MKVSISRKRLVEAFDSMQPTSSGHTFDVDVKDVAFDDEDDIIFGRPIYVVVAERDTKNKWERNGPIIFETNLQYSALHNCHNRVRDLNGLYGEKKIAKLICLKD